jgi:hypothetical protein
VISAIRQLSRPRPSVVASCIARVTQHGVRNEDIPARDGGRVEQQVEHSASAITSEGNREPIRT